MTRCIVLIAGMALGWALSANEATAQSAPRGSTKVRPTLFNPFASFSLSRFTLSPFGFVEVGAANTSGSTTGASGGGDTGGDEIVAAAAVRPPYRPPVRSPYRPPPRPPF